MIGWHRRGRAVWISLTSVPRFWCSLLQDILAIRINGLFAAPIVGLWAQRWVHKSFSWVAGLRVLGWFGCWMWRWWVIRLIIEWGHSLPSSRLSIALKQDPSHVRASSEKYSTQRNTLELSSAGCLPSEFKHLKVGIQRSHGLKFLWIPLIHCQVVRKGIVFDYTGGDLHEREELGRGHEPPLHCWKAFWKLQKRYSFHLSEGASFFRDMGGCRRVGHKRSSEDPSWSRTLWQVDARWCKMREVSFDEFSRFFNPFCGLLIGRDILQKGSSEHEESCTLLRWLATNSTSHKTQCLFRNSGSGANFRMTVWQESRVEEACYQDLLSFPYWTSKPLGTFQGLGFSATWLLQIAVWRSSRGKVVGLVLHIGWTMHANELFLGKQVQIERWIMSAYNSRNLESHKLIFLKASQKMC